MKNKNVKYKQCVMKKPSANGMREHIAWIPKQFAVKGKIIDIDGYGKGWEVVFDGGDNELSAKNDDAMSQMYKKTRRASDI